MMEECATGFMTSGGNIAKKLRDDITFQDIKLDIKRAVSKFVCQTGLLPSKIIMGSAIEKRLNESFLGNEKNKTITFAGIPVEVDYISPLRLSLCLEHTISLQKHSWREYDK